MTEPPTLATKALPEASAVASYFTVTTLMGISSNVWLGACCGVVVFMVTSRDRTVWERLVLFPPSAIGSAFAADAVIGGFSISERTAPFAAFLVGLVGVLIWAALIAWASEKGAIKNAITWLLQRFMPKGPPP